MDDYTPLFVLLALFVVLGPIFWWISTSNKLKKMQIKVEEGLSGVEVALTKRYDTLTKMLDVTKGYAAHEKDLFTQVIQLRRGMTVGEMNEKAAQLDALTTRIYAVAENYPELRSAEVFRELQTSIRGVEEHLQAARRLFNSNVSAFNSAIVVFPSSIVANKLGLVKCEFFVAEEAKREDVRMNF